MSAQLLLQDKESAGSEEREAEERLPTDCRGSEERMCIQGWDATARGRGSRG